MGRPYKFKVLEIFSDNVKASHFTLKILYTHMFVYHVEECIIFSLGAD